MLRYLVTGGAGFIGSNFIKYMVSNYKDIEILNIDKLTYAGNLRYLKEVAPCCNYYFARADIGDTEAINYIFAAYRPDIVVHFAAETHVDKSISFPDIFIKTNVLGTGCLLNAALRYPPHRFIQVSTDEVYGSLGHQGSFSEISGLNPGNPYAASKAGADHLVYSYYQTYGLPVIITRCTNNYGPAQYPEKLLPLVIKCCLQNRKIPVYGTGMNVREWIQVQDHCRALDMVSQRGRPGEIYNIGSGAALSNIEIVKLAIDKVKKQLPPDDSRKNRVSQELIEFVNDRPGHDFRYALNSEKIKQETGFAAAINLEEGIKETVDWYLKNEDMLFKHERETESDDSVLNFKYLKSGWNRVSPDRYSLVE